MPADKAARRVARKQSAFPLASVDGYANLIPSLTNHLKDRRVLAAAIRGGADAVVTSNVEDFPTLVLTRYDIEAVTADEFLCDQLTRDTRSHHYRPSYPARCCRRPRFTIPEFYRAPAATAPTFAADVTPLAAGPVGALAPGDSMPLLVLSLAPLGLG